MTCSQPDFQFFTITKLSSPFKSVDFWFHRSFLTMSTPDQNDSTDDPAIVLRLPLWLSWIIRTLVKCLEIALIPWYFTKYITVWWIASYIRVLQWLLSKSFRFSQRLFQRFSRQHQHRPPNPLPKDDHWKSNNGDEPSTVADTSPVHQLHDWIEVLLDEKRSHPTDPKASKSKRRKMLISLEQNMLQFSVNDKRSQMQIIRRVSLCDSLSVQLAHPDGLIPAPSPKVIFSPRYPIYLVHEDNLSCLYFASGWEKEKW
jgi:hypothetical protein